MSKKTTFEISKIDNFSEWYSEILARAEIVDLRYKVKGFVVIRPWGARIIDNMYKLYVSSLRSKNHEPTIFPTVIPERNFKKESSHVDGFAPEVFWLDKKRGDDKLALRPTSETAFYDMFKLWIRSYRDLPMKMYQRVSVFRNETKATRPLIRDRELHWIESHNVFASKEDAEKQVQEDIGMTEEIMHKIFGIPFLPMKRPEWDKFPGAVYTVGSDSIMPNGKIIQQPSTHLLQQHFIKAFGVTFVDENEKKKTPWTTCYGPCMSRILASIISMHGDDNGLILPFAIAPVQVIVVPVEGEGTRETANKIKEKLSEKNIETRIDDSDKRPGEKFFFWEMKGVPFRVEIGEKELSSGKASIFIRDIKERVNIEFEGLAESIKKLGAEYDARLLTRADEFFGDKVVNCSSKKEIKKTLDSGKIARFSFCSTENEGKDCAEYIEKKLQARVMGTRANLNEEASGECPICSKKNYAVVYAGKSY